MSHHRHTVTQSGPGLAPAAKPQHYPLTAFPPSFVEELQRYLCWLADPGNGTDRAYPASTIAQRRRELTLAASALAEVWADPQRVTTLCVLVVPAHTEIILESYLGRAIDGKPSAFVRNLASTLVALACHWVKSPSDEIGRLIVLRHKLGYAPAGLTPETARLLRELAVPATRDALLALPAALAAEAHRARPSSARRRQQLRTAVAIELLLHTGMRLRQLATLRIGEHVSWPDGPHGALRIIAPGRQARDGVAQEFELAGAPQRLMEGYLERFGSQVNRQQPNPPLFANVDGTPVTDAALADEIKKATQHHIGICITPKNFRHFCATLLLDAFPDDYPSVKDLLGHRFLETTVAMYGGRQRHTAGMAWNAQFAQYTPPTSPKERHVAEA